MRVLFVGATGVIGKRVVPLLASEFTLKLAAKKADTVAGLTVIKTDISDFAQAVNLMKDVDAVVNCAIESPYREDGSSRYRTPDDFMAYNEGQVEVNVRGAYHLYEAAARAGVKKFVFISSMTVWLGLPSHKQITAESEIRPREFYACAKLFGDMLGRTYATTHDMNVLCLRLGQPYPIGHPQEEEWLQKAEDRGVLVHIEDIAGAISAALRAETPKYGAYAIVSSSEEGWIDTTPAQSEIGYAPRIRFTAEGIEKSDQK